MVPAAMVSTPVGMKSVDWLKTLTPAILAQTPAPI
jgi:branched-chain amino acid transport system substrate-binding protein